MCVFLWPSSFLAVLLFALNSAAASTRPGACATTLAKHLTRPTRAHTSTDQTCVASRLSLSLSLIFEPCLYSSRPRPRPCESWTKFFLPHPPSLAQPTRPAVRRTVSYHRYRFSLRVAMGSRRTSPIDFVGAPQFSQHRTLFQTGQTTLFVLFVCFVRAVPLYFRSTYTVQGPLCPNREPC